MSQPGKIVHEVRHGELAHFGQVPYGRYYGSVDATPLFLVLLGAYVEQTGDAALARRLEPHARAAIGWMLDHGGLTSRGYLVYRADQGGLANQNWKDSPGAICSADGTRPSGPVMAAGAQGYAYDALRRTAWLARTVWEDEAYAALLEQAAGRPAGPLPAGLLDAGALLPGARPGRRRAARSTRWPRTRGICSGRGCWTRSTGRPWAGGCWSRTSSRAGACGRWPRARPPYHPLSYHRGSVWPHDNALITLGLARYGLHDEARAVAHGLVDAATAAGHRLPEVLAGYGRDTHPEPVPYPARVRAGVPLGGGSTGAAHGGGGCLTPRGSGRVAPRASSRRRQR